MDSATAEDTLRMVRLLGCRSVHIGGGEPLLRPDNLAEILEKGVSYLRPGARFCVISFHSLEDRIVKEFFKYENLKCICPKDIPVCICNKEQTLKIITRKPVVPADEEIRLKEEYFSDLESFSEKLYSFMTNTD